MNTTASNFDVQQHTLANGLTILVKPNHTIPEVDIQLWYNVGSKDEADNQRGMAHLIEHMIFKGTNTLFSEGDLDGIIHKLAGYTNAFTSYDYTTYVFRLPNNAWHYALMILADCMENARFDEQMLNSEFKAVIAELKMYRDNYQSSLIEQMMRSTLAPHPYHHPIIGYKEDLWNLHRDDLYAFYREHYFPGNAVLVLVGDVDAQEVFAKAEEYFGAIPLRTDYKKRVHFPSTEINQKAVTLYRAVTQPCLMYAYKIPGIQAGGGAAWCLLALLLGRGKTSRIYQRLVIDLGLATDVECFDYGLFEDQLLFVSINPVDQDSIPAIEKELNALIEESRANLCEDWELAMIKKKAQVDFVSLLESNEQFAVAIGQSFLVHNNLSEFQNYLKNIEAVTAQDLQQLANVFLRPVVQHKGLVLALPADEEPYALQAQQASDAMDSAILAKRPRTTPIEQQRFAPNLQPPQTSPFAYPKPTIMTLENGLEVWWYNNPNVPQIAAQLRFAANYLHETPVIAGLSHFHSQMLLEGTKRQDAQTLNRFLEERAIELDSESGAIDASLLTEDLPTFLGVLNDILTQPLFDIGGFERVKEDVLSDLRDFWDNPMALVNQLGREVIYGKNHHPYANFLLGNFETIGSFTTLTIEDYHKRYISPKGATLVLVGDLGVYAQGSALEELLNKTLGSWTGPVIEKLHYPAISYEPTVLWHEMQRDQVALAFATPSLSRLDPSYDALLLLDEIVTGGSGGSMSSRLFKLREQTGLFYTIGGSLLSGAGRAPGMVFIRTLVSPDNLERAISAIRETAQKVHLKGVTSDELSDAKRIVTQSAISHFESNIKIANAFHFLKKYNFPLDLFDKRGATLSIINVEDIQKVSTRFCDIHTWSQICVGRKYY